MHQLTCLCEGLNKNDWRGIIFSLNVAFCLLLFALFVSFSSQIKTLNIIHRQEFIVKKNPTNIKRRILLYCLHAHIHTYTHYIILRTHALYHQEFYNLAQSLHLRSSNSARPKKKKKFVQEHARNQHTPYTLGLSGLYMIQNCTLLI
jgi:hypothetical protein